jgi:hypothetical protein
LGSHGLAARRRAWYAGRRPRDRSFGRRLADRGMVHVVRIRRLVLRSRETRWSDRLAEILAGSSF